MITNVGKGIAPKVKNLLIASAVVTGGLLTASLCKTPKPTENATAADKIEYYMNNETIKEPDAYEWDSRQSVVSNVVDNTKVTGQHIAKAADKATDHPVALTGALALELLGVGLAGAAIKRNKRIEYQKAALEKQKLAEMEEAQRTEEAKRAEEARKTSELEIAQQKELAKQSELSNKLKDYTNNIYNFNFEEALSKLGVTDTKHPIKKGYIHHARLGVDSHNKKVEYFQTSTGKIIEAGIREYRASGIEAKDYNYAYVRIVNPTLEDKVCELGRIHKTEADGRIVEYDVTAEVDTYQNHTNFSNPKPFRRTTYSYNNEIQTSRGAVKFPEYEQIDRKSLASSVGRMLTGEYYAFNYDSEEFDIAEKELKKALYKNY